LNLKNYTSGVSVFKTVAKIEEKLVEVGATNILKEYENGKIKALMFQIPVNSQIIPIRLPVKTSEVLKYFQENKPPRIPIVRYEEQSERTAWKSVLDWVEIQIQMIILGQVKFEEVFMPYIWVASKNKTLFESHKDNILLLTK